MHDCTTSSSTLACPARRRSIVSALASLSALAGLQGCATSPAPAPAPASRAPGGTTATLPPAGAGRTPGSSGTAPMAVPAPAPAPASNPLAAEREWLRSWFDGTPVQIEQRGEGPLNIDVPREFCFDAGSSRVLPALAAVLDKVAESLRRTPQAQLQTVAAPGDSAATSPLAMQRARQVRARLLSRGVASVQMPPATVTAQAAVQLQLTLMAP
ncbi:MAG: hypothetical protein Q7U99_16660 [Rubrivivax sp.]|nr:hypothetical protein [Rubrivivax sp.]MDP3222596.1 hypothetical protein [Rubrivivax sp.]